MSYPFFKNELYGQYVFYIGDFLGITDSIQGRNRWL